MTLSLASPQPVPAWLPLWLQDAPIKALDETDIAFLKNYGARVRGRGSAWWGSGANQHMPGHVPHPSARALGS